MSFVALALFIQERQISYSFQQPSLNYCQQLTQPKPIYWESTWTC